MRNRNHIVVVHLNDKEYDRLNQKCRQAGLRREQFARAAFEGINIRPRPPDTYKELAREIAAVGNNLNQIAHRVNSTGYVTQAQFEQVMDIMSRIWNMRVLIVEPVVCGGLFARGLCRLPDGGQTALSGLCPVARLREAVYPRL